MGTHIPLGGGHVPSVDFASAGWIWMLPRIIVPRSLANTVVPGGCTNGRVQQIALATSIVVCPAAGPRMCISYAVFCLKKKMYVASKRNATGVVFLLFPVSGL